MTRRPIVWLHSGEREPETDLWDPLHVRFVPRPHFWTRVAYTLIAWFAGILLGFLIAQHVLAAPRTQADIGQTPSGALHVREGVDSGNGIHSSPSTAEDVIARPLTTGGAPPLDATLIGIASWYATSGPGIYAAAGPALRVGHWRGRVVTVCAGTCVSVRLSDWCACPRRLIDLSSDAFRRLAPLSVGLVRVRVTWGGPVATPPATDSQP